MHSLLIAARALHFGSVVFLAGTLAFACLIAEPAFRRSGVDAAGIAELRRRFASIAWANLGLAVVSGAVWLAAIGAQMSGQPFGTALSQGAVTTVLLRTRFGEDWLVRLAVAGLLGLCLLLVASSGRRAARALALGLAAILLASLAWSGHGAATPGSAGTLHLAGDLLHLLAAGLWLGTLPGLALLLAKARRADDPRWRAVAGFATRRFSRLAVASVVVLVASGLINTWFLAGSVPALVGTEYGQLLLAKIALFLGMLIFAAVNLLRLTPRLAGPHAGARTVEQLRRNALAETALGAGVLVIVATLGLLPPALHTEPGWPFPLRIDVAALAPGGKIMLGLAVALFCGCGVGAVAAAAAGSYRSMAAFCSGLALALVMAWIASVPAREPAYPTSFYAPDRPYDAASIMAGAALYAENCALCHGAGGRGDGPAAAGLPVRPANLTEPHLFAHSPGDLFWWVSRGAGHGAMRGFAAVLTPDQRWDTINFIRARAAGMLARSLGPAITTAAYPVPDFAVELDGRQQTVSEMLRKGPVLLVLFGPTIPADRLRQLRADRPRLAAGGLQVLAVGVARTAEAERGQTAGSVMMATVSPEVASVLTLFRSPTDGSDTELLLDAAGNARARWTGSEQPDTATLVADASALRGVAVAVPRHAGHGE